MEGLYVRFDNYTYIFVQERNQAAMTGKMMWPQAIACTAKTFQNVDIL